MLKILLASVVSALFAACAEAPASSSGSASSAAPVAATTPSVPVMTPETPPQAASTPAEKKVMREAPAAKSEVPVKATGTVWKMKKGKLSGTPAAKVIAKDKDPKSGQMITTFCWRYETFAVIGIKGSGEVGTGEVDLRRESKPHENLCKMEFSGKVDNLDIIEGDFAGVAGDFVVIEGADATDGPPQFQILSTVTNKEVFKGVHNPAEEFSLTRRGHRTSLTYFTRIPVKCELADEGAACWSKVLAASPLKKHTAMPDCKGAFAKAKVKMTEDAVVTVEAEVGDLNAPKVAFIGGKATCAPVPDAEKL